MFSVLCMILGGLSFHFRTFNQKTIYKASIEWHVGNERKRQKTWQSGWHPFNNTFLRLLWTYTVSKIIQYIWLVTGHVHYANISRKSKYLSIIISNTWIFTENKQVFYEMLKSSTKCFCRLRHRATYFSFYALNNTLSFFNQTYFHFNDNVWCYCFLKENGRA